MHIMTARGWRELPWPNVEPAPPTIRQFTSPAEETRRAWVTSRFRKLFETADGKNSLETGRFYHISHDEADQHS